MSDEARSGQPRLLPVPRSERDPAVQEQLDKLGHLGENNLFTTLIRHPTVFKRLVTFGSTLLLRGVLPARDRELFILRTAHLCNSAYEWGHHSSIATNIGMDEAEIERVRQGPENSDWSDFDRVLLRAADELHERSRISDSIWAALSERYNEQQLIEITAVAGMYHLSAYFANSAGLQLEDKMTTIGTA